MRRASWIVLAALAALLVSRCVREARTDPVARIRALLESMADGFSDGSPGRAVRGLSEAWRDADSGIDRDQLRAGLAGFFLQEGRDALTHELAWRAELPPDELHIVWDPQLPDRATAEGRALFHRRSGASERVAWELGFVAEFELGDDGWRIARTETRTLSGRRP